jgi:DNA-directed RNA polymerase subunit RPC12/RpoP
MDKNKDEKARYDYKGIGLDRTEKKHGQAKFDEYCSVYHITQFSDLQLLEELIYRELLQERIKYDIENKQAKNKEEKKDSLVPKYMVEGMNQNLEQILALKEKLGLLANREGQEGYEYIEQLKEKFKIWKQENQDRSFACPHCSKMILLYQKPEAWELAKHPFFESKILGNKKLWELYKTKKLTKQEIAEVLGCSILYIDWLSEKIYNKSSIVPPSV